MFCAPLGDRSTASTPHGRCESLHNNIFLSSCQEHRDIIHIITTTTTRKFRCCYMHHHSSFASWGGPFITCAFIISSLLLYCAPSTGGHVSLFVYVHTLV